MTARRRGADVDAARSERARPAPLNRRHRRPGSPVYWAQLHYTHSCQPRRGCDLRSPRPRDRLPATLTVHYASTP